MTIEEAIKETQGLIEKYADHLMEYGASKESFEKRQKILETLLAHQIELVKLSNDQIKLIHLVEDKHGIVIEEDEGI